MKKTKFKKNILIPILSFAALFIIAGLYNPLSVSRLSLSSEKIERPVKIALISDLHSCRYGRSQSKLIEAIDRQKPDIICLAGVDDPRGHSYSDMSGVLFGINAGTLTEGSGVFRSCWKTGCLLLDRECFPNIQTVNTAPEILP